MNTPTVVRVRLRFNDVEAFVEKFAPNVTRGGLFLATRNLRPVGELVAFELLLTDGTLVLGGEGKITWTKAPDPSQPTKPFGMGVQFLSLRPESKPILARLLKAKEKANEKAKDGRPPLARPTGALPTLQGSGPGNTGPIRLKPGTPPNEPTPPSRAVSVDPHVDLGLEMGFDDVVLREVASRLRMAPRPAEPQDVLEELLKSGPDEPATLERALADLPRLLGPASRRRVTGTFRPLDLQADGSPPLAEERRNLAPEQVAVPRPGSGLDQTNLTAPT